MKGRGNRRRLSRSERPYVQLRRKPWGQAASPIGAWQGSLRGERGATGARQRHLARSALGRPPAGGTRCLRHCAAAELPRASSCQREAVCVRHDSTAKRSRKRTPSCSRRSPVWLTGDRRLCCPPHHAPNACLASPPAGGSAYECAATGAPSEATVSRPPSVSRSRFTVTRRSRIPRARLPCCCTRMPCHVHEADTIVAVASLQEILTEKASRADGNTELRGDRKVVTGRLAAPGIQAAEGNEHGRSEASRSDSRLRQTGLPRWSHASGPNPRDADPEWFRRSDRSRAMAPSGLDFCGTLYVDMPSHSYPVLL